MSQTQLPISPYQGIPVFEEHRGNFSLSTDLQRLDIPTIHSFLSNEAYWCRNIPLQVIEKAIAHSLCFGVYQQASASEQEQQVGFSRVITDYATYAYICDVFILADWRGQGLGKWIVDCIRRHPHLQGLRRWSLATRDAHSLYAQFGFQPVSNPERLMQIVDPEVYLR